MKLAVFLISTFQVYQTQLNMSYCFQIVAGGQNRNQYIASMLLLLVSQQKNNIIVIDHKFLISGHTHMECDSVHATIEHVHKHL